MASRINNPLSPSRAYAPRQDILSLLMLRSCLVGLLCLSAYGCDKSTEMAPRAEQCEGEECPDLDQSSAPGTQQNTSAPPPQQNQNLEAEHPQSPDQPAAAAASTADSEAATLPVEKSKPPTEEKQKTQRKSSPKPRVGQPIQVPQVEIPDLAAELPPAQTQPSPTAQTQPSPTAQTQQNQTTTIATLPLSGSSTTPTPEAPEAVPATTPTVACEEEANRSFEIMQAGKKHTFALSSYTTKGYGTALKDKKSGRTWLIELKAAILDHELIYTGVSNATFRHKGQFISHHLAKIYWNIGPSDISGELHLKAKAKNSTPTPAAHYQYTNSLIFAAPIRTGTRLQPPKRNIDFLHDPHYIIDFAPYGACMARYINVQSGEFYSGGYLIINIPSHTDIPTIGSSSP